MTELQIPNGILIDMVTQAKTEAPVEACGILAGKDGIVKKLYKMTNTDHSRDHFMMAPEEQFKVAKDIRASGLELLAIYHSHPDSPARPSKEDIRLAITPDIAHVIVSVQAPAKPKVKAFKVENGIVTAIPAKIMKG